MRRSPDALQDSCVPQIDGSRNRVLVLISARTGAIDKSFPDVNGNPNVVLSDGHGGWFVAGTFTCFGNVGRRDVAHLHPDGTVDPKWKAMLPVGPETDPIALNALALVRSTLYVGGSDFVAAVDAKTGVRRWLTRFTGEPHGDYPVYTLAANTERVFVGGSFTHVNGKSHHPSLIALSPKTGRVARWSVPRLRSTAAFPIVPVGSLELSDHRLFVAALMTSVNGKPRHGLAAVDARTGALIIRWTPPFRVGDDAGSLLVTHERVFTIGHDNDFVLSEQTGAVDSLTNVAYGVGYAVSGDTLYMTGNCRNSFDAVRGHPRNNLAAIDISTGRVLPWDPPLIAKYTCGSGMAADKDQVLLYGDFTHSLG